MKKLIQLSFALLITFQLNALWNPVKDYPTDVTDGAFAVTANGKAYLGGGLINTNFYEYDPQTDTYKQLANVPSQGSSLGWAGAFSIGGKIYVCGGSYGSASDLTDKLWEYEISSNTWTEKAAMPGGARDGAFAFSLSGMGYYGGGFDGAFVLSDMYQYNPSSNSWTKVADYAGGAIIFASYFTIEGKAYVGMGAGSAEKTDFYAYDPMGNSWTQKASFPGLPRQANFFCSYKKRGFVGGGMNGYSVSYLDFWEYDSDNDSWSALSSSDFPMNNTAWGITFVIGNKIYAGLGTNMPTFNSNRKMYTWSINDPYLGLKDYDNSKFVLYPNPANEHLTIETGLEVETSFDMILMNSSAQVITRVNNLKGSIVSLNLDRSLSNGHYQLVLISEGSFIHRPFVLSR